MDFNKKKRYQLYAFDSKRSGRYLDKGMIVKKKEGCLLFKEDTYTPSLFIWDVAYHFKGVDYYFENLIVSYLDVYEIGIRTNKAQLKTMKKSQLEGVNLKVDGKLECFKLSKIVPILKNGKRTGDFNIILRYVGDLSDMQKILNLRKLVIKELGLTDDSKQVLSLDNMQSYKLGMWSRFNNVFDLIIMVAMTLALIVSCWFAYDVYQTFQSKLDSIDLVENIVDESSNDKGEEREDVTFLKDLMIDKKTFHLSFTDNSKNVVDTSDVAIGGEMVLIYDYELPKEEAVSSFTLRGQLPSDLSTKSYRVELGGQIDEDLTKMLTVDNQGVVELSFTNKDYNEEKLKGKKINVVIEGFKK